MTYWEAEEDSCYSTASSSPTRDTGENKQLGLVLNDFKSTNWEEEAGRTL